MTRDDEFSLMSKIALEQATQTIAKHARIFAHEIPSDMSGRLALIAFATAIESTNKKTFPMEKAT